MIQNLISLMQQRGWSGLVLSETDVHPCLIRPGYIIFQKDALKFAISDVANILSRLRHASRDRNLAKRIIFLGEESEFDVFMNGSDYMNNSGRNANSLAMGYAAGHCGYTCPDRFGCEVSKLWTERPNYSGESLGALDDVLRRFCSDLTIDFNSTGEVDAMARFLEEHKYYQNEKIGRDIGLEAARLDFESRFNKFFLHMGFKLGSSGKYAACYREQALIDDWMYYVHGVPYGQGYNLCADVAEQV
jgi:hypothetical protein